MSLSRTWAPYFDNLVKQRGRSYFEEQRVALLEPKEGELVRATVKGTNEYRVTLEGEGSSLAARCTCPQYKEGRNCKHIWAAILQAEQQQNGIDESLTKTDQPLRPPKARKREGARPVSGSESAWSSRLSLLRSQRRDTQETAASNVRQLYYVVSPRLAVEHGAVVVELQQRQIMRSGWGKLKPLKVNQALAATLPRPRDRALVSLMLGGAWVDEYLDGEFLRGTGLHSAYRLPRSGAMSLLRRMIKTGRCLLETGPGMHAPLELDTPEPWVLFLAGTREGEKLHVDLELRRGEERISLRDPALVMTGRDGLVIYKNKLGRLHDRDAGNWISQYRDLERRAPLSGAMEIDAPEVPRFLERLYMLSEIPELDLPAELAGAQRQGEPVPHMEVAPAGDKAKTLPATIWFEYEHQRVEVESPLPVVVLPDQQGMLRRDTIAEQQALGQALALGVRRIGKPGAVTWSVSPSLLPTIAPELFSQGWKITAGGRNLRRGSTPSLTLQSGVDWFELRGAVRYQTENGEQDVQLPTLLAAMRAGKPTFTLDDGSEGLLPQQWLKDHALLTAVGRVQSDHLRFKVSQAALLDVLLQEQESIEFDEPFAQLRERLASFSKVEPADPAPTFVGTLRNYQREGLGWLRFLREMGMGGILADDMGLGKTVQVLAMLDALYQHADDQGRTDNDEHLPTLIVAPRSVVFNWLDEAAHFAPRLRVQAYSGTDRQNLRETFSEHDVIITTYGLIRRDIDELRMQPFDTVVLDEAQAIKNPKSQAAKSVRLLESRHRLALTGTPVENHLGDLWSIVEFLNPGMLGSSAKFADLVRRSMQQGSAIQAAAQASQALRPMILRRTKKQVLTELPEKTEQTIVCEMEPQQRQLYDELLAHYRSTLLGAVEKRGNIGGSTMLVLEALLRLRQAACHPALIDPARANQSSAKVDELCERLVEMIDEGHKALVFSQFTSMLALVQTRLKEMGIEHEYLDGQTRDRRQRVEHFQQDPSCSVFLISLKAGGLGLNLTAADYVFILDPWWNPAVEQQAVDRAHRIGQDRHVFAYRLICENTVEQRIADLQEQKKLLAEAIIGEQESVLQNLTRDELEYLLK